MWGGCQLELFSDSRIIDSAAEVDAKFVVTSVGACAYFMLSAAVQVVFSQVGRAAPASAADALKQTATGLFPRLLMMASEITAVHV